MARCKRSRIHVVFLTIVGVAQAEALVLRPDRVLTRTYVHTTPDMGTRPKRIAPGETLPEFAQEHHIDSAREHISIVRL